ncbi:MAG: iron-containing redox enzyme family protein [Planctomycetes bacterium]|nr:iron-containing redox enzyme family protein [Planctomycetota bacterium]
MLLGLDADIAALEREASTHPAVHHPFLQRFARGEHADPRHAIRTYAREYSGYSRCFPQYLESVIARLPEARHRELLLHNLEEERGHLGADDCEALRAVGIEPATVDGVPHPQLFRRFCAALGLGEGELAVASAAARRWSARFLQFLNGATPAQAVGALGLGTEHVVRPIYTQLLQGIAALPGLRREDYVFFELHCLVDDQHQQDLLAIARDLAAAPGGVAELRSGMQAALRLRHEFWDYLEQLLTTRQEASA